MDIVVPEQNPNEALEHPLVRALLASCFDGVIVVDATNRTILRANSQAETLLGYRTGEVLGCKCDEALQTSLCKRNCPLESCNKADNTTRELKILSKSGDIHRSISARSRMILVRNPQGEPVLGIEIFRDLTEIQGLERALDRRRSLNTLIGSSAGMQRIYMQVEEIAEYEFPVLITGENGSGRTHVAEVIHKISMRRTGPLIRVSCTSLSLEILECSLFGHEKDDDAYLCQCRASAFEQAEGGTLIVEDIDALPPEMQDRIASVLLTKFVRRLGEDRPRQVNFRFIATASCLANASRTDSTLSPELGRAICTHQLNVPPLRERLDDIQQLCEQILTEEHRNQEFNLVETPVPYISDTGLIKLMNHPWAGNVSELSLVIREAYIRLASDQSCIGPEELELSIHQPASLADAEWNTIEKAMVHTGGNLSAAARVLGIDRTTLWRKLKKRPADYQEASS